MAEVIQLDSFKRKQAATRGFRSWSRRFKEKLDEQTRLSDLSNKTLLFLISPGDQNIFALYQLVMGVKDLGTTSDFFQLDKAEKMVVIDISIYLLDQLRFECMRRLNWLESSPRSQTPIVDLVEQYPQLKEQGTNLVPSRCESHPKYQIFNRLSELEKETFVRKQIPEAIETFGKNLQE
ncbi:MAG: hypothetical protein P8017_02100 [Deltaproteobacteria bacterium]